MRKGVLVGSLLLILILGVGSVGYGAEENSRSSAGVYTLGEVVVTGERGGDEPIGTVLEVTAKDIEDKNARTLDEALELLPGLDVRSGAQGIPRINLRGLRSRHIVFLLNGIPFNSTYDGQFDPSIIPTENIAKIKLSYGTHSVLYGQGGLGGVINIITKKGTKGFNGGLSGEVDERGGNLGRFNVSGGDGQFDYFLSGSAENSDGYRISGDFDETVYENGGLRENSDRERENLFANVGFSAGEDWNFGLTVQGSDGEFGKPPSSIDNSADDFAKNPKYERVEDYGGFSGQLSASYDPNTPFGLRAWIFYNELDEDSARYDDDNYSAITKKNSYEKDDETRIQGGTLQTSYDFNTAGYMVGSFSAQKNEYESDGEYGNGALIDLDEELNIYSAALEYHVSPMEDLEFVVGYGHHWLDKDDGDDDDGGSYLLGVRYFISEKTSVRASLARKIRFPSIKQLYEVDGGNPDLNTEKSMNYELGITHLLPFDMEAGLVGFWIDVDDYIEKDAFTDINENHDEYRMKGFEVSLQKWFMETGSVRLGYTFLDSEDRSSGTQVDELEYRPEHKIALDGSYAWHFGLSAYASIMYLTDQYHYSDTDPLMQRKLNSITVVDFKLQQKLVWDQFYAYAGVNNLFDKDYEESYGFPQVGRMVYGGLKVIY